MMNDFIFPEGFEEVKKESVELYKGKNNYFYEKDLAEYEWAIGRICRGCGKPTEEKYFLYCSECRDKTEKEQYLALEVVEWDEETPVCLFKSDQYFFDKEEVLDYVNDADILAKDLMLVLCERETIPKFYIEEFLEPILPEDYDLGDLEEVNTKINQIIKENTHNLVCWIPSNKRIIYSRNEL